MKFTDGYWLLREGVTAAYPAEVLDVDAPTQRGCTVLRADLPGAPTAATLLNGPGRHGGRSRRRCPT